MANLEDKEIINLFVDTIRKKKVYEVLEEMLNEDKEMTMMEIAIECSSLITHSLLFSQEATEDAEYVFDVLRIGEQIELFNDVVNGEADSDAVKEFFSDLLDVEIDEDEDQNEFEEDDDEEEEDDDEEQEYK